MDTAEYRTSPTPAVQISAETDLQGCEDAALYTLDAKHESAAENSPPVVVCLDEEGDAADAQDPKNASELKEGASSLLRSDSSSVRHPGRSCAQFSCQEPVGWSQSRGRFAKLCVFHLKAHRIRCAKSATRRRNINQKYREKARMYDVQSLNLSAAHEEIRRLRVRLTECERELRRTSSSSASAF